LYGRIKAQVDDKGYTKFYIDPLLLMTCASGVIVFVLCCCCIGVVLKQTGKTHLLPFVRQQRRNRTSRENSQTTKILPAKTKIFRMEIFSAALTKTASRNWQLFQSGEASRKIASR
jgi:hypothetical protein